MPILSVFFGIIVRMWHDDHPPPHIHVEYQGFGREQIKMIKVIEAKYVGGFQVSLIFSDGAEGHFNGREFLKRSGPMLDALRDESFFRRVFIDAGALCWPNGLELSPTKLRESCVAAAAA